MSRRRAPVLPALTLLLTLLLTGCLRLEAPAPDDAAGGQQPALATIAPTPSSAAATLEPACPAPDPEQTLSAAQVNRVFSRLDLPYWASGDVGVSTELSDGRIMWAFGDTVRPKGQEPLQVDNSILVSSGTCVSQLLTGDRRTVLPLDQNELSVWPMSILRLAPTAADGPDVRDVVVVYCSRVQRGDRMWDFGVRGTMAARYVIGTDGVPRLTGAQELTPDRPDLDQINWGAAAAVDGDWIYLYGTASTGEARVYGRELFVSRVPVEQSTDPATMQFWDGSEWQDDSSRVVPIIGAVGGVSQTLSVDLIDGVWTAVSKIDGDIGDTVGIWTSDQPTGPWTVRPTFTSRMNDEGSIEYTPVAHPEIRTPNGTLLVSVSRNDTDYETLIAHPELGRPLFTEVPLA